MTISRRSAIVTLAAAAGVGVLTACTPSTDDDGSQPTTSGGAPRDAGSAGTDASEGLAWPPSGEQARATLQELLDDGVTDAFQLLRLGEGFLAVDLLEPDGGTTSFSWYPDGWEDGEYAAPDLLSSAGSLPLADLPLDLLPNFVEAAGGEVQSLIIQVDHAGLLRVSAGISGESVGLLVDGRGRIPRLDIETVDGVRDAVAELVASYGTAAAAIGSFNDFVHMDANVEGVDRALRVVRYDAQGPSSAVVQEGLLAEDLLFDPTSFDPTLALEKKPIIVDEAGVVGQVWDWKYSRPPQGGDPLVSFGVGESGPSQRIWLNPDGSIAQVVDGNCEPGAGWCPA